MSKCERCEHESHDGEHCSYVGVLTENRCACGAPKVDDRALPEVSVKIEIKGRSVSVVTSLTPHRTTTIALTYEPDEMAKANIIRDIRRSYANAMLDAIARVNIDLYDR